MRRILGPLVLALGTAQALGGTILTGASDIGSGAAPKQGVVEILPDAPPGPPPRIAPPVAPGSIGPLPPPIPPFSGGGSGADGAFFAASDETLVGGIREYTTYIVPAGVTVTYEGDVEVRASGPVAIAGTVLGTGGIAFRCEGSFDVTRASEAELFGGITASGDIDIDAVGTVRSSRFLESRRGSVEIVSHHVHATPTVDAGIRVDAGVWSARGVRLVSASSLLLGSHCDIRTADVALRAQNVTLDGANKKKKPPTPPNKK